VLQIGRNKVYDRKSEIPINIPGVKRSGIGIIVEFHRIPTGFPNQGCSQTETNEETYMDVLTDRAIY
jgi:hypothetical protein